MNPTNWRPAKYWFLRKADSTETRPCWVWTNESGDEKVAVVEYGPTEFWVCTYEFTAAGDTEVLEKYDNLEVALVSATLINLEAIHASQ